MIQTGLGIFWPTVSIVVIILRLSGDKLATVVWYTLFSTSPKWKISMELETVILLANLPNSFFQCMKSETFHPYQNVRRM